MPLKASIPPQQLLQLAAAEPLPTPQQHDDKPSFSFPMNDDVTDPLAWLNDRALFFRGQHTPNNIKIGYEIFHLIEIAHLQYMHLTEDKAATDREHFVPCTNKYIDPPTRGDLWDERQQINICTTCDKHPTHILDTGNHMLVGTGVTHSFTNMNFARLIGLQEHRIDTTIFIGNGNEVSCKAAAFNVSIRIDGVVFDIDIGTPWLASLVRVTWDFTTMQLQHIHNDHPVTFTTAQHPQQGMQGLPSECPRLHRLLRHHLRAPTPSCPSTTGAGNHRHGHLEWRRGSGLVD
jgi:hypothetical protein